MKTMLGSSILVTSLSLVNSATAYTCPLPQCKSCLPPSVREAPGIGFELTTSYGTASAQYQNGTIHHVSLAPATPDYIDLMTELSRTTHASPSNLISRTLRRLNKRLGRPSTPAVGTLSTLISALRTATEAHLPTLDRVVVTAPQFPGLTREDLRDAIEYSGLRSWLEYPLPYPTMLYTLNAAYAGTGRGLCKDWRDIYSCWEEAEEGEIPLETVLGITYTNKTLSAAVARVAYAFEKSPGMHAAWPELGWDEKKRVDEEGRDLYWRDVATRLRSFVQEAEEKGRKVSSLVLMGENAGMQEFQDVLKEALALRGAEIMHVDTAVDPTWAASTGAAMYARVRQEVPWNCRAPDHCDESGAGADEDIKFQVEL